MTWNSAARKSFGWAALAFSPILFVMAAISTVHSLAAYYLQLAVFSAASGAGVISGVSALLGLRWTAKASVLLAGFGGIYFLSIGLLIAFFSSKGFLPPALAAILLPILIGVGLLFLAHKLGRGHAP
jgi:hypothetical protein